MKDEMKRDINKRGNSTLSGSWDVAKTKEGGYSAIPYDGISGINVSIFQAEAIAFMLNYGGGGGGGGSVALRVRQICTESSFDASDHYVINPSILSLSEGLQFIQKGAKEKEGGGKIKLNYIELLIDLTYQRSLGEGSISWVLVHIWLMVWEVIIKRPALLFPYLGKIMTISDLMPVRRRSWDIYSALG